MGMYSATSPIPTQIINSVYMTVEIINRLRSIRESFVELRSQLNDWKNTNRGFADRVDSVGGLMTCGIHVLYDTLDELTLLAVRAKNKQYGDGISFSSRGIGLDSCGGCFICGAGGDRLINNISAFITSQEEGKKLLLWFNGRGYVDFRPQEPTRIQFKIGACDRHLPALTALENKVKEFKYLWLHELTEIIKNAE